MSSTTAERAIEFLRSTFARFGIPEQIVSDNGPQWTSEEFNLFLKQNGIKHYFSAPYHPSTNGLVERFIQTKKSALKKGIARSLQHSLSEFLLNYRNTVHATTQESPAKLLLKRDLRTRLNLIRPDVETNVHAAQAKQVFLRERKAKDRPLAVGDCVMVKDYRNSSSKPWKRGVRLSQTGPVSFQVQLPGGEKWRRHADQIIHTPFMETSREEFVSEGEAPHRDEDLKEVAVEQNRTPN